jgi:hypothetical protein
MRTLIICHDRARLDREGLSRWLASFSTLVGAVVIREAPGRRRRRVAREINRIGWWRFLDVLAFRAYSRIVQAPADRRWEANALEYFRERFPAPLNVPEFVVASPNAPEAETFIRECSPDLVIARCKTLLKPAIFSVPALGTYVMHPGICPEYRNAHGCFWALANDDGDNVGLTLLKVDHGVDTGPVYGHFRITADPARESHTVIQQRAVLEHLDDIRDTLLAIAAGKTAPIDTTGRESAAWGQPWLSAYVRMRLRPKAWSLKPGAQRS